MKGAFIRKYRSKKQTRFSRIDRYINQYVMKYQPYVLWVSVEKPKVPYVRKMTHSGSSFSTSMIVYHNHRHGNYTVLA